jgi:hypothetical protein
LGDAAEFPGLFKGGEPCAEGVERHVGG